MTHDHDHLEQHDDHHDVVAEPQYLASEHIELMSAGIDIGSATCRMSFSRLQLERDGVSLSSRYRMVTRTEVYSASAIFTPYHPDGSIAAAQVRQFVADAYRQAGVRPEEISTGVVLLTGEAARRGNAEELATTISAEAGEFVCAAAGHSMEGALAAHGSGTVEAAGRSRSRLLNLDIGGGTTKFTLAGPDGVEWSFAVHAGGRLAAFGPGNEIVRLERQGSALASAAGVSWDLGDIATDNEIDRVGEHMAQVVASFLPSGSEPARAMYAEALLTPFPGYSDKIAEVVLSGGVAAFVRADHADWRSDLGASFGHHLWRLLSTTMPTTALRHVGASATVLGASEYSVQVSGNTIHLTSQALLPLRNRQVVRLGADLSGDFESADIAAAIDAVGDELAAAAVSGGFVLAVQWAGSPEYRRLAALAVGLADASRRHLEPDRPLCVILEGDVAKLVGALLEHQLAGRNPVVVVDGILLSPLDYVDLGAPLMPAGVVPVTVKSLIFR